MNTPKPDADKWSARVWHRRASKPVSIWMMVFILAGLTHFLIPNYRWVLIHIFTLGILTNSILVWSQHLTEKFVQQRLADAARPAQLARIYAINAAVVITLVGNMFRIPPVTITGAALVAGLMWWQAAVLWGQWRQARGKRFRIIVAAYAGSAAFLPMGAFFGGWLALDPGNPRLIIAHVACNVGGFVGLAAAASLTVLFPAVWRSKGITAYVDSALLLLVLGVAATVIGAFGGFPEAGLLIYTAGWVLNWQQWLGNVSIKNCSYPALSVLAAVTWLVLTLTYFAVTLLVAGTTVPAVPVAALLVGFAGQLLIGMMAYLLPTTMGGGPAAVRAGLQAVGAFGPTRAVFTNGGLLLWINSEGSYTKVIMSALCLGSLAVIIVLMPRAVKAQRAVLMKKREAPAEIPFSFNQTLLAIAILGSVWALLQLVQAR